MLKRNDVRVAGCSFNHYLGLYCFKTNIIAKKKEKEKDEKGERDFSDKNPTLPYLSHCTLTSTPISLSPPPPNLSP